MPSESGDGCSVLYVPAGGEAGGPFAALYFYDQEDNEDFVGFLERVTLGSFSNTEYDYDSYNILLSDQVNCYGGVRGVQVDGAERSITLVLNDPQRHDLDVDDPWTIHVAEDADFGSAVARLLEILDSGGYGGPVTGASAPRPHSGGDTDEVATIDRESSEYLEFLEGMRRQAGSLDVLRQDWLDERYLTRKAEGTVVGWRGSGG